MHSGEALQQSTHVNDGIRGGAISIVDFYGDFDKVRRTGDNRYFIYIADIFAFVGPFLLARNAVYKLSLNSTFLAKCLSPLA